MSRKWKLLLLNCTTAGLLTFFTSIGTVMALLPDQITFSTKIIVALVNAGALSAITFLTTFRKCMGFDTDENPPGKIDPEDKDSKTMSLCEFHAEDKPRRKRKTLREMMRACPPMFFI